MPDIDYMTIKASEASVYPTVADPAVKDNRVIDLQGRVVGDVSNNGELTPGVYIVNKQKVKLP